MGGIAVIVTAVIILTHICRVDSSTITLLTGPFHYIRGVWLFFLLISCFVEISELIANSVDSEQTPRSVASDLGLCLLSSHSE